MSSNNDSGLAINRDNYDLKIGNGGDVATTTDGNELIKDLSLQLVLYFRLEVKGEVPTDTDLRKIETDIRDLVENDERVQSVSNVSVARPTNNDPFDVRIGMRSDYGFNEFSVTPDVE